MHDNASLPSSTPSTPPASGHNPGGIPTSPPGSQQAGAASSASFDRMTGVQSQGQAVGPSWAGKRAQEEADYAKEKCVDKMFTLRKLHRRIMGLRTGGED